MIKICIFIQLQALQFLISPLMENFQSHRIHILLFHTLLSLLQFSSLHLFSSAYNLPDKYFINCGSSEDVNDSRRSFIGDENTGSLSFSKQSSRVENTNQSLSSNTSSLYDTARVFRQQSSYAFDTNDFGNSTNYQVRLHFLAFSSAADLSAAVFDVSASGFLLLNDFTAKNNSNSPLIKEFYLPINTANKKFRIYFTPKQSSFAFVNAIEVFPAPPVNFNLGEAIKVGLEKDRKTGSSSVLQTVYRINVGGEDIESGNEMLWRNWDTDDNFLITKDNSKNAQYSAKPIYQSGYSEYIAPDLVYQTAREMNENTSGGSNITWGFSVNKSAGHLVRFHFCDIISISLNMLQFNIYINGNFSKRINPIENSTKLAAPFYYDFVVGAHDSSVMNIGIGSVNDSTEKNAFLNGLEILEIQEGKASTPIEKEETGGNKIKTPVVIGSTLGGFAVLCILVAGLFLCLRRRKTKPAEHSSWGHVPPYVGGGSSHSRITDPTINGSPVPILHLGLKIPFAEIQLATKNFNQKLIIGRGGFGNVYKGTLVNGIKVAVKRSAPGSGQGLPEFQTEIMVLSKIRHRHLVSLIGYCDERSEMILVYEYMEKGTLRDHLYNQDLPRLSWKQRLEICIGAANGLHYLHKGSSGGIIHRDVKSTNILLDQNHVAKVADFGLSKSGPLDEFETHVSTNVKGTFGYLDPEYFRTQQLTEKSDVYSFGVVLLEVLCARPAIDNLLPREQMNLAEWAMNCKHKGLLEEIIDPSIKGQINQNSLRKFSETVEKCLQDDSENRPAMSDVIWDLEYTLQLQQTPVPREPHEDSTANTSSMFLQPNIERFPSISTTVFADSDEKHILSGHTQDFSGVAASEVFSQLRIDDMLDKKKKENIC